MIFLLIYLIFAYYFLLSVLGEVQAAAGVPFKTMLRRRLLFPLGYLLVRPCIAGLQVIQVLYQNKNYHPGT